MQTQWNYFAPRVGFAYRVSDKTVVRGGFGISYTPFEDNTYAYNYPVRANNGYNQLNSYTPAVLTNGSPFTFEGGFPAPVPVTIPSQWHHCSQHAHNCSPKRSSIIPLNYHNPYVDSWNIALQQDLAECRLNAQLNYVANHGTRIGVGQNINLAHSAQPGSGRLPLNVAFKKTASATEDFLGYSTNYQSLQAELNRHIGGNLYVTTSFTWGKGLATKLAAMTTAAFTSGSISATAMHPTTSTTGSTLRKA